MLPVAFPSEGEWLVRVMARNLGFRSEHSLE